MVGIQRLIDCAPSCCLFVSLFVCYYVHDNLLYIIDRTKAQCMMDVYCAFDVHVSGVFCYSLPTIVHAPDVDECCSMAYCQDMVCWPRKGLGWLHKRAQHSWAWSIINHASKQLLNEINHYLPASTYQQLTFNHYWQLPLVHTTTISMECLTPTACQPVTVAHSSKSTRRLWWAWWGTAADLDGLLGEADNQRINGGMQQELLVGRFIGWCSLAT